MTLTRKVKNDSTISVNSKLFEVPTKYIGAKIEIRCTHDKPDEPVDPAVIILAGQPHVRERLLRPIHRSINQRIKLKYHIPPLSKENTIKYIIHQLVLCGADKELFNENALSAIYRNSCGIPGVINTICQNALNIGAIEKKNVITEEEIYRASKEL